MERKTYNGGGVGGTGSRGDIIYRLDESPREEGENR
jgi:hypothetical protein